MSSGARRVGQRLFDWTKLASRVPEEARAEFNGFRARHEACKASLNAYPEKPEPINWEFYKRNISAPNLVKEFQKQFEAVSVPYPKDTASAAIAEQQKEFEVQAQELIAQSKEVIQDRQKELDTLKSMKPLEEMTIDEFLADKPELRQQIERDTKNHDTLVAFYSAWIKIASREFPDTIHFWNQAKDWKRDENLTCTQKQIKDTRKMKAKNP